MNNEHRLWRLVDQNHTFPLKSVACLLNVALDNAEALCTLRSFTTTKEFMACAYFGRRGVKVQWPMNLVKMLEYVS